MSKNATGRGLRDGRLAAGMTQAELAKRARISISHISNMEAGRVNPSIRTAVRITKALNCSLEQLISIK